MVMIKGQKERRLRGSEARVRQGQRTPGWEAAVVGGSVAS